ncbi:MAG TPA: helix-turn-helix domain-containing protein [Chloroflexota bacterium]|nr:helix-turn-helix domain-containing protein [Chloroflexota bacterium]
MWPITTTEVARVLGVSAANLRRWIRQGKFEHLEGMSNERRPGTFQDQRRFTRAWVEAAAKELQVDPDFSKLEGTQ